MGESKYSSTILDLELGGGEWFASRPFYRQLDEPHSRSGHYREEKCVLPLPEVESGRWPRRPSLYRPSYPSNHIYPSEKEEGQDGQEEKEQVNPNLMTVQEDQKYKIQVRCSCLSHE
jgi:hypothetical protein